MCIICIKKQGVEKPTQETIKVMARKNPDGFGVMYYDGQSLQVVKSMNLDDILKENDKITKDMPAVYHFRIATHGSVNVLNCHPFYDEQTGYGFAHNGILSIQNEGDMTDSETAFRRIILPNAILFGMDSYEVDAAVQCVIGSSKFALLNGDKLKYWGQFTEDLGGLLFSNGNYKEYQWQSSGYNWNKYNTYGGNYDAWDDGYYDDDCCAYFNTLAGYDEIHEEQKDFALEWIKEDMEYIIENGLNTDDVINMYDDGESFSTLTKKEWKKLIKKAKKEWSRINELVEC